MSHCFEHPAANYVRYLVLVLDDPARDSVNRTLASLGVAELSSAQHDRAVRDMSDTPSDFRPWDRMHAPSSRWLRARSVYSMVHQDDAARAVQQVLSERRLREATERMLIGRVPHVEVAYRLRGLGWTVGEQAVADYRHYFWNTELLGVGDWAEYFRADVRGRTRDVQDGYDAALHAGPQLALYRSGVAVEVDRKGMMYQMCKELAFTFQEVRTLPTSPKKVEMLASLVRSYARVDERLEAGDAALQDVLRKFEKFKLLTDSAPLPSMVELAPTGSFSDTETRRLTTTKKENA